jgi:hypothetical protein
MANKSIPNRQAVLPSRSNGDGNADKMAGLKSSEKRAGPGKDTSTRMRFKPTARRPEITKLWFLVCAEL